MNKKDKKKTDMDVLIMRSKIISLYEFTKSFPLHYDEHQKGDRIHTSKGLNLGGEVQVLIPRLRTMTCSSYDLEQGAGKVIELIEALIRIEPKRLEAQPSLRFLVRRLYQRCQELQKE